MRVIFGAPISPNSNFNYGELAKHYLQISLEQCVRITWQRSTQSRFCTWVSVIDYLSRTSPFGTTITAPLTKIRVWTSGIPRAICSLPLMLCVGRQALCDHVCQNRTWAFPHYLGNSPVSINIHCWQFENIFIGMYFTYKKFIRYLYALFRP